MPTTNITLTTTWTKLADAGDTYFLIGAADSDQWECATTAADAPPTVDWGHRLGGMSQSVSRDLIGGGYVWGRAIGGYTAVRMAVTK